MGKKITEFSPRLNATMTGMETEGLDAGEIVCPIINLWVLGRDGIKIKVRAKIPHGAPVTINKKVEAAGSVFYYVRSVHLPPRRGWVTERFVILEEQDAGAD